MPKKMKHLVAFDIPDAARKQIERLSKRVYSAAKITQPSDTLPPHVTICPPQIGIDEQELRKILRQEAAQAKTTKMTFGGLFPFGKRHVILPVQTTRVAAVMWIRCTTQISSLNGYKAQFFEEQNILHSTVATMPEDKFDIAWPVIRAWNVPSMTVPLSRIILYRKPNPTAAWEVADVFHI